MKRVIMSLVAAIGIAVVLGGGIWVAGTVNTASKAMTPTTVVNPQMAAVPNGGVSTGDGSMSYQLAGRTIAGRSQWMEMLSRAAFRITWPEALRSGPM